MQGITAESLAVQVLREAGVPAASMTTDSDDLPFCDRAGYLVGDSRKTSVSIGIIGNSGREEISRQAERDGLTQQARAALDGAGWTVRVNEFGNLYAKTPLGDALRVSQAQGRPETDCMHCREKIAHTSGFGWMHERTGMSECGGDPERPTGLRAEPLEQGEQG